MNLPDHSSEDQRLRGALSWQKKPGKVADKLDNLATAYLNNHNRRFGKVSVLMETWQDTLPAGLQKQCRLKGFISGTLFVEVTPGAYLHQMNQIRHELLKELKIKCPGSGLKAIKIVPMTGTME